MWISHAMFCPKPTEAQYMLKDCIFDFLSEWWHEKYFGSQKQGCVVALSGPQDATSEDGSAIDTATTEKSQLLDLLSTGAGEIPQGQQRDKNFIFSHSILSCQSRRFLNASRVFYNPVYWCSEKIRDKNFIFCYNIFDVDAMI